MKLSPFAVALVATILTGSAAGQIAWTDEVAVAVKKASEVDRLVFVYVHDTV